MLIFFSRICFATAKPRSGKTYYCEGNNKKTPIQFCMRSFEEFYGLQYSNLHFGTGLKKTFYCKAILKYVPLSI